MLVNYTTNTWNTWSDVSCSRIMITTKLCIYGHSKGYCVKNHNLKNTCSELIDTYMHIDFKIFTYFW